MQERKKNAKRLKKAAEQKTSLKVPAPMEEKQKAGSDGTSWHHELLFKHHNDLLRQPKRKIKQKNASKDTTFVLDNDNSDGEEEKITDPIMHEMNKIPGYQELGDQGAEDVSATISGEWTEHQSGGVNSMVNPQALLYFEETGIHRVEITLERPKKLRNVASSFLFISTKKG